MYRYLYSIMVSCEKNQIILYNVCAENYSLIIIVMRVDINVIV